MYLMINQLVTNSILAILSLLAFTDLLKFSRNQRKKHLLFSEVLFILLFISCISTVALTVLFLVRQ